MLVEIVDISALAERTGLTLRDGDDAADVPEDRKDAVRAVFASETIPLMTVPPDWIPAAPPRDAAGESDGNVGEEYDEDLVVMSAAELVAEHPYYRQPIIDGLLREGESMNVIAAPKVGKSWLVLLMAFCIANGAPFLGRTCAKSTVLIIDNELHHETAAERFRSVAKELGLSMEGIHIINLRGKLEDLPQLRERLVRAAVNLGAKVIVLDALYRLLPDGTSENDNSGMMQVYNCVDSLAMATGAAVVCIHHSSKGNQGEKSITDGGSGAGSISRAADTHLILREHEDDGQVVMEAVARSWLPPKPVVLSRTGLIWQVVGGADPTRIKGRRAKAAETITMDVLLAHLAQHPEPVGTIFARLHDCGINVALPKLQGMLGLAISNSQAVVEIGPRGAKLYGRERSPGGSATLTDKAVDYLRGHPDALHADVAAAVGCDTKTVQRASMRLSQASEA